MDPQRKIKDAPRNETNSGSTETHPNPEYIKMYYDHQYDRMAKLEDQGLLLTNIITTITLLSFTFSFDSTKSVSLETSVFLPILIIVINSYAIFYIIRTSEWIKLHRRRAKLLIKEYKEDVKEFAKFQEIEKEVDKELEETKQFRKKALGRRQIQRFLHAAFIILSLVPIVIFLISLK